MFDPHICCPVCGVRRDNLSRRGGSNRWWYSVDSNRHLLVGQLDETLAALSCNDHICPNASAASNPQLTTSPAEYTGGVLTAELHTYSAAV